MAAPSSSDKSGLEPIEALRYARHLTLPGIGLEGQQRLRAARILVVGAGGLGSPAALYLAAAGVGTIGIADFDRVDLSNLQRQILHGTSAIGMAKVDSAAARLADLNPHVRVVPHRDRLTSANARAVVREYDVILDGSDNFPTRYLLNDAAVLEGRPLVYGSIFRFDGQVSVFHPPAGPCYRCLFAEPPAPGSVPSCAEGGVLGVLPGIVGSLQALEAIKLVTGTGEPVVGRLLLFNALRLQFREIEVRRDPNCPICGTKPSIRELIDYEAFCGVTTPTSDPEWEISPATLQVGLSGPDAPVLVDVREPWEHGLVQLKGSTLLPLDDLAGRVAELPPHREIVTYCHHGVRSLAAARFLRAAGFGRVRSLAGGIDAWAREVEPGMVRY